MEAAAQLEALGLDLSLSWIPRDKNAEADDLSNFRLAGFTNELRVPIDLGNMPFLFLDKLIIDARDFYNSAKVLSAGPRSKRQKTRPEERLRATDPW